MKTARTCFTVALLATVVGACGGGSEDGRKVDASGKEETALDAVPAEVLAVAQAAQPELRIEGAEYETRDGNEYYDVGGVLPDGSELELDMTKLDGVWTVVETQRDIDLGLVPEGVGNVLGAKFPDWQPNRIIESDQGEGVVIYEFFGKDDSGADTKIEVKWADGAAELLVDEWVH